MDTDERLKYHQTQIQEIKGDLAQLGSEIEATQKGFSGLNESVFESFNAMAEAFNEMSDKVYEMGLVVERLTNGTYKPRESGRHRHESRKSPVWNSIFRSIFG